MQDRLDADRMKDRMDAGQDGCMTGWMQDRKDTGQKGFKLS